MWGQAQTATRVFYRGRIIPMRVGTSLCGSPCYLLSEDHPHACGDKICQILTRQPKHGSSPCVWGQVALQILKPKSTGIIPMRVGTSTALLVASSLPEDHPHACGDKYAGDGVFTMWERIIPMRVGTSRTFSILYNPS